MIRGKVVGGIPIIRPITRQKLITAKDLAQFKKELLVAMQAMLPTKKRTARSSQPTSLVTPSMPARSPHPTMTAGHHKKKNS